MKDFKTFQVGYVVVPPDYPHRTVPAENVMAYEDLDKLMGVYTGYNIYKTSYPYQVEMTVEVEEFMQPRKKIQVPAYVLKEFVGVVG